MLEAKRKGINYRIIASGQNNIKDSDILKKTECGSVDLELSREENIIKSTIGLIIWWIMTYRNAIIKIRKKYRKFHCWWF